MSITITSVPTTIATNGFNQLLQADGAGRIAATTIAATSIGSSPAASIVGNTAFSTTSSWTSITTSDVAQDVVSLSLSAGNWLVYGNLCVVPGQPGTDGTLTRLQGWLSTTSATFPTEPNAGSLVALTLDGFHINNGQYLPVGMRVYHLTSTQTVYLSTQCIFDTVAICQAAIGAIRLP